VKGKGRLTLFSVKYEGDKPVEQEVQGWDVATKNGSGALKLKVPVAGQFRISVKITDSEGHEMEGAATCCSYAARQTTAAIIALMIWN
jgi:hypothetical protein